MSPSTSPVLALWVAPLALIAAAFAACGDEGNVLELEEGDCIADRPTGNVSEVDFVECDSEEAAYEVLSIVVLDGDEYPGDDNVTAEAELGCAAGTTDYLLPTQETWEEADDREIVCFGPPGG
jgi:hypothetical protein